MIDRQIDSPMPMPSVLVVNIGLNIRSSVPGSMPSPVSSTDTITYLGMDFGPYGEHPLSIFRGHGFDRVRHQIHEHLLKLDLFASYPWQPFVKIGSNDNPMCLQSVANDGQRALNDIVDIKRSAGPY